MLFFFYKNSEFQLHENLLKFNLLGIYKCFLTMRILEFSQGGEADNICKICKFSLQGFSKFLQMNRPESSSDENK